MNAPDPLAILDALNELRETLRGMVAGLITDGFTDEQARVLVVRILSAPPTTDTTT